MWILLLWWQCKLTHSPCKINPEEITNYFDKNLSIDKKAEILESFLKIKEYIFNDKEIKLFNVIKTPDNTLFIFQKNNDYLIIKSKTNNQQ